MTKQFWVGFAVAYVVTWAMVILALWSNGRTK